MLNRKMSEQMARYRISQYEQKHGAKPLNAVIRELNEIKASQKDMSKFSRQYRLATKQSFELALYRDALERLSPVSEVQATREKTTL